MRKVRRGIVVRGRRVGVLGCCGGSIYLFILLTIFYITCWFTSSKAKYDEFCGKEKNAIWMDDANDTVGVAP